MSLNKLQLETDGLVVGVNQLVTSGNGVSVGNNLVVQGNTYLNNVTIAGNTSFSGPLVVNSSIYTNGAITLAATPFYETTTTVAADYSITSGMNAFSPGPITINVGINVTVPVGSTWTIS